MSGSLGGLRELPGEKRGGEFRGASLLWSGAATGSVFVVREQEKSELNMEQSPGAPEKQSGLSLHFIVGLFWGSLGRRGRQQRDEAFGI